MDAASSGLDPAQTLETVDGSKLGLQQSSVAQGLGCAEVDMNNYSLSVPGRLKEVPTHSKVEPQLNLTNSRASPANASTEQSNSVDRVHFDRRKRRPAAIITRPGFYVPNYIESGDPLMNENKLRNASPPERVLVGHGRPKVPKLYFENSAPLLGSNENLSNEDIPDHGAEPPHSAPSGSSDSWRKIPNVMLTPRCLRLMSSDLAERLGRRSPNTPRSPSFNQPSPRFENVPNSPISGATGIRRTREMDDSPLHPEATATDDRTASVATSTLRLISANVTNEPSNPEATASNYNAPPSAEPELDVVASIAEVVGSLEELEKGGGAMVITDDSKGSNHRQNERDATDPAGVTGFQQIITPKVAATSERISAHTPDLALPVSSSNMMTASTKAARFPTQLAKGEVTLPNHDGDNTGLRVYGSMMDSADLGIGSVNRGLGVGVIPPGLTPHAQQTQQQDRRQQLPQRPQGIRRPSVSQAQQHHPQANIPVASRGLYNLSVNQPRGFDPCDPALIFAYEIVRINQLRSLPAIHHNLFGIPANQVGSFQPNIPGLLPLMSSPFAPTNGPFDIPNDTALPARFPQSHSATSSRYPPQMPHHRPQFREGRYGRGRQPGATNLTAGVSPANHAQGVMPTGSVNLSDDTSLSDPMPWQEDYHPRSLNVLNLPGSSVPGAASLLSGLNPPSYSLESGYCCWIIRSKSEDDVRASITHGIWSSTEKGNERLNEQYNSPERDGPFLLIFCVNGSREVCGMAEMLSPVDFESMPDIWQEKDAYKGSFKVRWIFCKNAGFALFSHILLDATRGDLPALHLRDALPFNPHTGRQIVRALAKAPVVETILTHPKTARNPRRPRGQNPTSSGTITGRAKPEARSFIQARRLRQ